MAYQFRMSSLSYLHPVTSETKLFCLQFVVEYDPPIAVLDTNPKSSILFSMLLLLGDISVNPGPTWSYLRILVGRDYFAGKT
jgi:hypothetical protein